MEILASTIFIMAGTVWFILLFTAFFEKNRSLFIPRRNGNRKKWLKKGIEAEALVLGMEQAGMTGNDEVKVNIQLQVQPAKGRSFVVEIKEVLFDTEFYSLQTGSWVWVKYNPDNYRQLLIIKRA